MILYLYENEIEWMKRFTPDLYEGLKENIEVKHPFQHELDYRELQEKLGEIARDRGYRMASDQDLSGVSHLGARADYVLFDEPHNLTTVYESGEPGIVTQKWLEHRRTCRRTLLECLSGETH